MPLRILSSSHSVIIFRIWLLVTTYISHHSFDILKITPFASSRDILPFFFEEYFGVKIIIKFEIITSRLIRLK
jgi:hypothetical protein